MLKSEIQLSEEIGMYLDRMRSAYPNIAEIWLIGARVGEPAERDASWEFVVFADEDTLRALGGEERWQRGDVKMLLVTDEDRFRSAWGRTETGSLTDWSWSRLDPHTATYEQHGARRRAIRVR